MALLLIPVHGQNSPNSYLPLQLGRRWVLRSAGSSKPIVFEVLAADRDVYRLRFDNPWISSELRLLARDGRYYVTALTMNGQTAELPPDTLYWDTSAGDNQKWSSPIGKYEIVSRHKIIAAMGKSFSDCVEIQETNKQGNKLYWTFAPGVGFIQFGEGKDAFLLESLSTNPSPVPAPSQGSAPRKEKSSSPARDASVRVALGANTFANEAFDARAVNARFRQARDAGINLIYISPKWNEIETGRKSYKFSDIDYQIGEASGENLPAILHIRVIDTNQRAMPSDLAKQAFDSSDVFARLDALLDAMLGRLAGRVQYFLVGNEINAYFDRHPEEVQSYARLVSHAAAKIRQRIPGAHVSVSVTFDALSTASARLQPILDQTDFLALTYYPMSPDFVVRSPSTVDSDFPRMLSAAGSRKIFLQEVGYPSSAVNHSSEDMQAEVFSRVFGRVAQAADRFIGMNFTFMSDFSDQQANDFARYYGENAPGVDRFRAFLKTLGMFDNRGRPKKSWQVFKDRIQALHAS